MFANYSIFLITLYIYNFEKNNPTLNHLQTFTASIIYLESIKRLQNIFQENKLHTCYFAAASGI